MGKKHASTGFGEHMELRHEPVPGYGKALSIVVAVAALYLVMVFVR